MIPDWMVEIYGVALRMAVIKLPSNKLFYSHDMDIKQMDLGDMTVIMLGTDRGVDQVTVKSYKSRGIDINKQLLPQKTIFMNKTTGLVVVRDPQDFKNDW